MRANCIYKSFLKLNITANPAPICIILYAGLVVLVSLEIEKSQYFSRVVEYYKRSFKHLKTMGIVKKCKKIIPMMILCGQTQTGHKIAAAWAGLAVLSCR